MRATNLWNKLLRYFARLMFRLFGWQVKGQASGYAKEVLISAPHTSNWDFILMIGLSWAIGLEINWLGKQELFGFWGVRHWLTLLGGIPVKRDKSYNQVEYLVELINMRDSIHLCVPPEGTRKFGEYWRTGFYHISLQADIPVTCAYLDFRKKEVGIGPTFKLTGDQQLDLARIKSFYLDKYGKYPEQQNPICFKLKS